MFPELYDDWVNAALKPVVHRLILRFGELVKNTLDSWNVNSQVKEIVWLSAVVWLLNMNNPKHIEALKQTIDDANYISRWDHSDAPKKHSWFGLYLEEKTVKKVLLALRTFEWNIIDFLWEDHVFSILFSQRERAITFMNILVERNNVDEINKCISIIKEKFGRVPHFSYSLKERSRPHQVLAEIFLRNSNWSNLNTEYHILLDDFGWNHHIKIAQEKWVKLLLELWRKHPDFFRKLLYVYWNTKNFYDLFIKSDFSFTCLSDDTIKKIISDIWLENLIIAIQERNDEGEIHHINKICGDKINIAYRDGNYYLSLKPKMR